MLDETSDTEYDVAVLTSMLAFASLVGVVVLLALSVRHTALVRADIRLNQQRTEAWMNLRQSLALRAPAPLTTPWTATPALMVTLVQIIADHRPRRIVELGSGFSTMVCAYALERYADGGHLYSLDHEAQYAQATRELLARHEHSARATVLHAPLETVTTEVGKQRWYQIDELVSSLAGEQIDLLIVDGPPGKAQPLARYPALERLQERLAPDAVIVVDDAARDDEREMMRRWSEVDRFEREDLAVEKGVTILRRVPASTA